MQIPSYMEITASLMAGYRFGDGSLIEVDAAGDYRITNAYGTVIEETVDSEPGQDKGVHRGGGGPPMAEDYGDILDDLAAFLQRDGEEFEYNDAEGWWAKRYGARDTEPDYIFTSRELAKWAMHHDDELSMLACYREDKRLGEGQFASEEKG